MEKYLSHLVEILTFILEAVSVICIISGLVGSVYLIIIFVRQDRAFPFLELRLQFGSWLALALEFQLGSDILATIISPSFQALGKLASLALIRTFLNYFLMKELQAEKNLHKKNNQI